MPAYKTKIVMGLSGSRHGITSSQKKGIRYWLTFFAPRYVVHGCCVGADEVFDIIAAANRTPRRGRPCKPPGDPLRANCECQQLMPVEPCLKRNTKIVCESDVTLLCPQTEENVSGSGTWFTYFTANIWKRNRILLLPSGEARCNFNPHTGDQNDPQWYDLDATPKIVRYVPSALIEENRRLRL